MLKAIRKHLKASKKSTTLKQYMKIGKKDDHLDTNWTPIHVTHVDKDGVDAMDGLYATNELYRIEPYRHPYPQWPSCVGIELSRIGVVEVVEHIHNNQLLDAEAIQLNRQHLHALHRFRRHKKRGMPYEKDVVISFVPKTRASIVNKRDFYYRFGKEEEEAMACFDFLDDIECDNEYQCRWDVDVGVDVEDDEDLSLDRNSQLSLSDSCVEYYDSSD